MGLLVLATVFWGLSFPLIKSLVLLQIGVWPHPNAAAMVAATVAPRVVIAGSIVLLFSLRLRPFLTARELAQGLWVGGFGAVGMLLQNDGLRFTAASTSAFLTQFYAISIPLFLALRSRRAPPWPMAAATVLVLAGVAILGRFDWRQMRFGRGELETLLASLFFMGQILWLDHPAYRENRALPLTWVMMGAQAVVFGALGLAAAPSWETWRPLLTNGPWLALSGLLALACTLLTYFIMNRWQRVVTATEAGLIYCFEPIFGSLFALCTPALFSRWSGIAYANERITLNLLIGGALITLANILIQLKPPPRRE